MWSARFGAYAELASWTGVLVVCCAVSLCEVLVLVLVRNVWCVVCVCVCAWCVLCVRGVCVLCVMRLGTRKNSPCVGSKRLRVYVQNASVCTGKTRACLQHMRAFCGYTRGGGRGREGGFSSLSSPFSLSLSLPVSPLLLSSLLLSLFRRSLPSFPFSFSFSSLFSSFFSQ